MPQDREHLIKLSIQNIDNVPSGSNQFDEDLLNDEIHLILLLYLLLQSFDLFLMMHMGLLNEIVGSRHQVGMGFEHRGDCVKIVFIRSIVFSFNFLK